MKIQRIHDMLQCSFPQYDGLAEPGLGQCVRGSSLPRFPAVRQSRFVQLLNVGDHWLCVTNAFTDEDNEYRVHSVKEIT